jgi:hypothetical protein
MSIMFTLYEKSALRGPFGTTDERMIASVSGAIPYLSQARVLLDIHRFAAKQTAEPAGRQ